MIDINQLPFKYPFTPLYVKEFEKMEAYYKAEEPRVRALMRKLINQYCFENRANRDEEEQDTKVVFFFQGSGQNSIIWLGLEDKYGDSLKDFLYEGEFEPIYSYIENENILSSNQKLYDKDIDFEQFPMEYAEPRYEQFYALTFAYIHAWLAYLWQEEGGNESGIYGMTLQNNSVETFHFAHFTYDYINLENSNDDEPLEYPYGKLSFEEILLKAVRIPTFNSQSIKPLTKEQILAYHIKSDNLEMMQKAIDEGFDIDSEIEGDYVVSIVGENKAYQIFELLLQQNVNLQSPGIYQSSFALNPIFLKLLKKYKQLDWVLSDNYSMQRIKNNTILYKIISED